MAFERLRARLRDLEGAPQKALAVAASRVQETLREDATTARGNVPQFAPGPKGRPMASIPIRAVAVFDGMRITAADWVLAKAKAKGQPAKWRAILSASLREAVRGGS